MTGGGAGRAAGSSRKSQHEAGRLGCPSDVEGKGRKSQRGAGRSDVAITAKGRHEISANDNYINVNVRVLH